MKSKNLSSTIVCPSSLEGSASSAKGMGAAAADTAAAWRDGAATAGPEADQANSKLSSVNVPCPCTVCPGSSDPTEKMF